MRPLVRSCLIALVILGGFSSVGTAEPKLTVSFNTTPVGALYAPKNVVAVWIEGPTVVNDPGPFVKTIGRWASIRFDHLVAWTNMAGLNDIDAVSGATRLDHAERLTIEWDLKDKLGVLVPDGIYTIRMETADANSTTQAQNWQGSFTFTKGLTPEVQTIIDDPHYLNVSIDFNPTAGECNNGFVDPGETCDPPGSCLTTCADSGDVCAPNVLSGSALTCNVACAIAPITTCINGDGCCAEGCTTAEDDDCFSNETVGGGCETGSGNGPGALFAFALVGAVALCSRRRR